MEGGIRRKKHFRMVYLVRLKVRFGDVGIYDNSWDSVIMFRCRSNTLKLGWRARFVGGNVGCVLCGGEEETLRHFLVECEELGEVRGRCGMEGVLDVGEVLLFRESGREKVRKCLRFVESCGGREDVSWGAEVFGLRSEDWRGCWFPDGLAMWDHI